MATRIKSYAAPRPQPRPRKPKVIDRAARVDMNAALARAIAHADIGHLPQAQHHAAVLVRLLREHGLLGGG
jgi:hypothetical protein